MPWENQYPYLYFEEPWTPRPIRYHSIWHDLDYLTRRVAVLEQKVQALEAEEEPETKPV